MSSDLKAHCEGIAIDLIKGLPAQECNNCGHDVFVMDVCEKCELERGEMSGFDYLKDALDIEYIVNHEGDYLGARILVAFGGPNIWINTRCNMIEGAWGNESYTTSFSDHIGLDDAASEFWGCR